MSDFTKINPNDLTENAIKLIGSDWMLITAGDEAKCNTMTASWGFLGFLWNKPVAVCFVRPERYTFDFIEKAENFTLSFFTEEHRKTLQFCGSQSGRDKDKIKETGLKPFSLENDTVAFEQAKLVLNCRKLYTDFLNKDSFIEKSIADSVYPDGSFHKMYIAEITEVLQK